MTPDSVDCVPDLLLILHQVQLFEQGFESGLHFYSLTFVKSKCLQRSYRTFFGLLCGLDAFVCKMPPSTGIKLAWNVQWPVYFEFAETLLERGSFLVLACKLAEFDKCCQLFLAQVDFKLVKMDLELHLKRCYQEPLKPNTERHRFQDVIELHSPNLAGFFVLFLGVCGCLTVRRYNHVHVVLESRDFFFSDDLRVSRTLSVLATVFGQTMDYHIVPRIQIYAEAFKVEDFDYLVRVHCSIVENQLAVFIDGQNFKALH